MTFMANDNEKKYGFVFDPVCGSYYCKENTGKLSGEKLPLYYKTASMGIYPCDQKGFYPGITVSAAEAFSNTEVSGVLNLACEKAIKDKISDGGLISSEKDALVCLVPDIMDEFGSSIRSMLRYSGRNFFCIPRSVLRVYDRIAEKVKKEDKWLCLDYDGPAFSAMQLKTVKTEYGNITARIGRADVGSEHLTYESLVLKYLEIYAAKNSLALTDEAKNRIVRNKLLDTILRERNQHILTQNGDSRVLIEFDRDVYHKVTAQLKDEIDSIKKKYSARYGTVIALSVFSGDVPEIRSVSDMTGSIMDICEKIRCAAPIWTEYIPELKLEYINNGAYDTFTLIGKDKNQIVKGGFVNTKQTFSFDNFTIPTGTSKIDLPIVQTVFDVNKDYRAYFDLGGQFRADLEKEPKMRLTVSYNWGDIDRYALSAETIGKQRRMEWKGKWIPGTIDIPNTAQPYCSLIEQKDDKEGFEKILENIRPLANNLKSILCRPGFRFSYEEMGKQYSDIFYDINRFGRKPYYFSLRNIASDKEKQRRLIEALFENNNLLMLLAFRDKKDLVAKKMEVTEQVAEVISENAKNICVNLTALTAADPDEYSSIVPKDSFIKCVNKLFEKADTKDLICLSAYVDPDKDTFGLMNRLGTVLYKETSYLVHRAHTPWAITILRSLSNVCWLTEKWIFGLAGTKEGPAIMNNLVVLIERAIREENVEIGKSHKNNEEKRNAKRLRDYLELLLCLCRLKDNNDFLNNNSLQVKRLVQLLKETNRTVRTLYDEDLLTINKSYSDPVFCTRISFEEDEDQKRLYHVFPLILSNIKVLTGMKPATLLGYSAADE